VNATQDIAELQDSFNRLKDWSDIWQLQSSTTKCVKVNICKFGSVNSALTVGEDTLPVKTMVKDLGATVDCNFKYNEHVKI